MKRDITQDQVKELYHYDKNTGVFIHKINKGGRAKKGSIAGHKKKSGYVNLIIKGSCYKAHRIAWLYVYGYMPENEIDHINRIKHDNRIDNLREASRRCNQINAGLPRTNTSGVKGVAYYKRDGSWAARVKVHGKNINLGHYKDFIDAVKARRVGEIKYGFDSCDPSSSAKLYLEENGFDDEKKDK